MPFLRLTLTMAFRELRGGIDDFRIFLGCLFIGVAVIAGVTTVSRHIEHGIRHESKTLMGGDLELSLVNQRATSEQVAFFSRYGRVSLTTGQRAMATFGDNTALVELKGVDDSYPLLGTAILSSESALHDALKKNRVVVEQGLLDRLDVSVGQTIIIGNSRFVIVDVLLKEPDRITSPLSLGPRVMAPVDALEKSGLLLPAGLIRYHYNILLNKPGMLEQFKQDLARKFPDAPWIFKTSNDNNRNVQEFVRRLQLFMTLAGLSALLIGGIGIMNAAEAYLSRKSEAIAIFKTLGASHNFVFAVYIFVILLITLTGSFLGAVFGSGLSTFSLPYLAEFLPVFDTRFVLDIPAIALSMLFGVLTVFTFSIAALGRGVAVKPALLFRGMEPQRPPLPWGKLAANALLAIALITTLISSASDTRIAIGFIGCAMLSFVIFAVITRLTKQLARHIHLRKPWARLAVANLYRPGSHTLAIMLSTGIGLTVLIALLLVEGNFQKEVDETMPAVAPSLFLIDIQPGQKDDFLSFLASKEYVSHLSSQPMVRGRISKINGTPVSKINIDSDARWAIESDRGLTYAAIPPENAAIAEGTWWRSGYKGKPLVSLDRKLARGMGLEIGDTLTVNILGREVTAEIVNLRDINYINFQINFALIFTPGALESFSPSYIATLRINGDQNESTLVREMASRFPNISTVRIKDSIVQIRGLIDHISAALRLCAIVVLLSGILVLASALAATLDKRVYDMVVLKVLGARRADIIKMFLTEWLLLACLTSIISCLLGSIGAWLILERLDWMKFTLIPGAVIYTVTLALVFITVTGFAIHTRIFNTKASTILRNE
jgi:putative ABC transport system permease protein